MYTKYTSAQLIIPLIHWPANDAPAPDSHPIKLRSKHSYHPPHPSITATMDVAFALPVLLPQRHVHHRRPRNSSPRQSPQAYADSPPPRHRPPTRAPLPWVETALLTLFEPADLVPTTPTPPALLPRWLAVWHSLRALYALRLRPLTPLRPTPHDLPSVTIVETPTFVTATGLDPVRALSRLVVFAADLLADAVVLEIISRIHHPKDVATLLLGFGLAYASADLVSAVYNWLRLNFSPNAALFGAPPPTTARSFSKVVAPHCAAVAPLLALMLASPPGAIGHDAFAVYFLTFLSLLPAFCGWAAGDLRPPLVVAMLQETGIVARRSSEACFETLQYCIVCGLWDGFLTRIRLFSALERWIYLHSGGRIRPRVWDIRPEARVQACGLDDELVKRNNL